MQQTNFNYIIPSEDNGISNPDTGVYTNVSTNNDVGGNANYFINSATIISLALILLSFIFFIVKKKGNKTKAFNDGTMDLKYKNKNNIISSIFATILLLSGLVTLVSSIINYHATATLAPNDDFTTKKDVTTTITPDNTNNQPITACATDTVTMTKALAHGYTLSFTASNIDPTISSITEYELTIDDETTPTTITPDDTITIKDITTATSAGDTTTVKLCVSFPEDIEPGTYTITGTYDSITNTDCAANEICYNDNGANSPTTMSNQVVSEDEYNANYVTLWASNFQYAGGGYGFAGWNTKANGTGTSYGPNEDITDETVINKIKSEGLDLYAIWIPGAGNLQNWNGCNTMNIGDVTALTDTRDNNTYAVAKLADGKCWMIENLRLGGEEAMTLTSSDSNIASGSSFTLSASQDPTTNAWCNDDSADCIDQSMLSSNNTTNTIANMTSPMLDPDESKGIYSMGNYYNWYSATAGTGTGSMLSGNATGSICPAGWHLPTGYTNGEFSALDVAMGGTGEWQDNDETATNRWRTYPANYVLSGDVFSLSGLEDRGVVSDVWSSTVPALNPAVIATLYLSLYPSWYFVSPVGFATPRSVGSSVRCVF
ncbi:hypothetical protein IJI29_03140 [Candidatus Saccharibacteria bacterium]|nr:hypothetical protein [Candidatus Saccharibacteria bacterium]